MRVEIISSGTVGGTIVRNYDTGEIINNVLSADIHLSFEGVYATLLISNPIIKYIGTGYLEEERVTIEREC